MDESKPANVLGNDVNESDPIPSTETSLLQTEETVPTAHVDETKEKNDLLIQETAIAAAYSDDGARWYYWIAALSIVNTIISYFKGDVSFIIGLGITQIGDGLVAKEIGDASTITPIIGWIIIIVPTIFYFLMGFFAIQKKSWAFITGMIFYFIDALIFLMGPDYFSIAFHAYALYRIFNGLKACKQFNNLNQQLIAVGINVKFVKKEQKF